VNASWAGSISQSTHTASLLSVAGGHATGTLAFSGTLSATSGNGLQFNNAGGTYSFTGTTTLNGGDAGVDITNLSSGTFSFGSGTSISNPTGTAFDVNGGSPTITYAGTITQNNARAVSLASMGGSATFSGNIAGSGAAATGVSVTSSSASVTFSGASKSLTTQGNAAVTLTNNSGSILFSGGGLAITTTSGAGLNASGGGGTVAVTGSNNTVATTGGLPVNIQNVNIGASNVTFRSVNKPTGSGYGIRLENTGTAGGFKVTGDGSTANSGGTLVQSGTTSSDSSAVTFDGTAHLSLEFMRISITTGTGASGIIGRNLSGTNLVRNSVIDYNQTAPGGAIHGAFALRVVQASTNATVTVDGVTMRGKRDGTTAASLSTLGTSVVTLNIQDSNTGDGFPSRYEDLFGSGWVIAAGDDVGSTAFVTANVSNTSFQNAPSNGLNNLELPLATAGVINLNATGLGRVGSNAASGIISGNSVSNIRSGAGPTFAYDPAGSNGYVGMRFAIDNAGGGVNHKLQILNNTITNVARQGLLVSARGSANNVNVRVQGNTIGTAANPVGTPSARRGVEIEAQDAASMRLEVVNNPSIVGGTSAANSALHIRAGVNTGATSTVNATVIGNTIANPNGATNDGRFRAETVSGNSGTMCLDLRNNLLENGAKEFQTNNNGGTYNRNASGNTGTVTSVGVVGAVASCPTPAF
jgi:hypothetical protein